MFEKYRQSSVGAWHSAKDSSDSPKKDRPNAAPLHPDVTPTTFQAFSNEQPDRLRKAQKILGYGRKSWTGEIDEADFLTHEPDIR